MYADYAKLAKEALERVPNMVFNYDKLNQSAIDHIVDVAASVMMTRDKYQMGGSFVQAVVLNDLDNTVNRADSECALAIRYFVYCNKYVHLPKVS
jgi:hypothetical protein